jgi:hypothetical protein
VCVLKMPDLDILGQVSLPCLEIKEVLESTSMQWMRAWSQIELVIGLLNYEFLVRS